MHVDPSSSRVPVTPAEAADLEAMSRDSITSRFLQRASSWGTAAIIVAAPLAVGGMRPEAWLLLSAAAVTCLMLGAWARLGMGMRVPWGLWGAGFLTLFALFQLLPLPVGLLETLSPQAAALREYSLSDLGLYSGRAHPLSLDPAGTWVAVFAQLGFLAVAILAANAGRRDRHLVLAALTYGGALVATIGLIQWGLEADKIFGLYESRDVPGRQGYFATFVNNNTLAGYLSLCALVGLGLVAKTDDEGAQQRALFAAALCMAGVFLSNSRGGQVSLFVGLLFFAALAHARAPHLESPRRRARSVANVALLLGVLGFVGALVLLPDWAGTRLSEIGGEDKFEAWGAVLPYIQDFWLTGSGRGTFSAVYPHYQELLLSGTVSHPENVLLQFAAEWGLPIALLAIAFAVLIWLHALTGLGREPHPTHWGLCAGLLAVSLQQLVDFGFESAGLALPVAAALGLVLAHSKRRLGPWGRPHPRAAAAMLVAGLVGAALLLWQGPGLVAGQARAALADLNAAEPEDVETLARTKVADHPASYLLPLATANKLATKEGQTARPLRWLNRALYLYPKGGKAHLLTARVLSRSGRHSQAAVEYRLAIETQPWVANRIIQELAARLPKAEHLARAVPPTAQARRPLGNALIARGRHKTARRVVERLLLEAPDAGELHTLRARTCDLEGDEACVKSASAWLNEHGRTATAAIFVSRQQLRAGQPGAAAKTLQAAEASGRGNADFQRAAAELYAQLGDAPATSAALDRLWKLVGATPHRGAAVLGLRGRLESSLGRPPAAWRAYEQAYNLAPRPTYALGAVREGERAGRSKAVAAVLADARARWPDNGALRRAADRLELH